MHKEYKTQNQRTLPECKNSLTFKDYSQFISFSIDNGTFNRTVTSSAFLKNWTIVQNTLHFTVSYNIYNVKKYEAGS